jgi:hypothetical protein
MSFSYSCVSRSRYQGRAPRQWCFRPSPQEHLNLDSHTLNRHVKPRISHSSTIKPIQPQSILPYHRPIFFRRARACNFLALPTLALSLLQSEVYFTHSHSVGGLAMDVANSDNCLRHLPLDLIYCVGAIFVHSAA